MTAEASVHREKSSVKKRQVLHARLRTYSAISSCVNS